MITTCHDGRLCPPSLPPSTSTARVTTRDCVVPFLRRVAGTAPIGGRLALSIHRVVPALARRDRDALKARGDAGRVHGHDRSPTSMTPVRRSPSGSPGTGCDRTQSPACAGTASRSPRRVRVGVVRGVPATARRAPRRRRRRWRPSWRSTPTVAAPAQLVGGNCRGPEKVSPPAGLARHPPRRPRRGRAVGVRRLAGRPRAARRRRPGRSGCEDARSPGRDGVDPSLRPRARAHGPAKQWMKNVLVFAAPGRGRRARQRRRPGRHAGCVRRLLPGRQRHVLLERRPRRRRRPAAPDEALPAGRRRHRAGRHRQDHRHCAARRSALGAAAATRAVADRRHRRRLRRARHALQRLAQACRGDRHRDGGVRLRAASSRRRGRRRRADVELVRAGARCSARCSSSSASATPSCARSARTRRRCGRRSATTASVTCASCSSCRAARRSSATASGRSRSRRARPATGRSTSCRSCRC